MTPQRQILAFAIALIVCCLAAIGFVVARQLSRLSDNEAGIRKAQALLSAVTSVNDVLRDAELSHRSFLVSGNPGDLESFRHAVASFEHRLAAMESALAEHPERIAGLATCRAVAARYRDLLAKASALGPWEQTGQARQLLAATREWAPVDEAGVLLAEMGADARRLLETRRQHLLSDAWTMQQLVFLSLGLTVFGGVLVTLQVRREVRLRRESEEEVRKALLRVDQRVRDRTEALSEVNRRLERVLEERAEALSREQVTRAAAERANELKDRFLATVSHELRTPLNAVVGWIHVLKSGALAPHEVGRAIDGIDRNVRTQVRLIDELLDVSHIAQGHLTLNRMSCDFAAIVDRALSEMRPAIDAKGVRLHYERTVPAVRLRGDPRRLQQVVAHLLMNALKFTPRDGQIDLRLTLDDGDAVLRVRDTGEGIDAAALPHLFETFYQAPTEAMRSGLGLGLTLVKELVELHGGTVTAASDGPRAGAEFTIRVPLGAPDRWRDRRDAPRQSRPVPERRGFWKRLRGRISSPPD